MNTITLPKNKYLEILQEQNYLKSNLKKLQNFVLEISKDEVSENYLSKLSKIENQISKGQKKTFKNIGEVKSFFKSLK